MCEQNYQSRTMVNYKCDPYMNAALQAAAKAGRASAAKIGHQRGFSSLPAENWAQLQESQQESPPVASPETSEVETEVERLEESIVPLPVARMMTSLGPAGVPSETRYEAPSPQLVELHIHSAGGDEEGEH